MEIAYIYIYTYIYIYNSKDIIDFLLQHTIVVCRHVRRLYSQIFLPENMQDAKSAGNAREMLMQDQDAKSAQSTQKSTTPWIMVQKFNAVTLGECSFFNMHNRLAAGKLVYSSVFLVSPAVKGTLENSIIGRPIWIYNSYYRYE